MLSEPELRAELQRAWQARRRDSPKIRRTERAAGCIEIDAIERIEKVATQLELHPFARQLERTNQRQVYRSQTGALNVRRLGTRAVSQWRGRGKRRRIEPAQQRPFAFRQNRIADQIRTERTAESLRGVRWLRNQHLVVM